MILIKGLQIYQRSKSEFVKNVCQLGKPLAHGLKPGRSADIFSEPWLWPLVSLQPLNQNQCLVLHIKDLLHFCLETKGQGYWMTFKVCNLSSKWSYFNRACVVRVCTIFVMAVCGGLIGKYHANTEKKSNFHESSWDIIRWKLLRSSISFAFKTTLLNNKQSYHAPKTKSSVTPPNSKLQNHVQLAKERFTHL